jgi:uncharacterized membrane protein YfcA
MLAGAAGARIAHRLPVKRLRIIFALLLYALAVTDAGQRLVRPRTAKALRRQSPSDDTPDRSGA